MKAKPDSRDRESALCCGKTRAEMVSDQLRGRQLSDRVNLSPTADNPHWIIASRISHQQNWQHEMSVKMLSKYMYIA